MGAKINDWKFLASEVDELSYKFACDNVRRNHLEKNINGIYSHYVFKHIKLQKEKTQLICCNFYALANTDWLLFLRFQTFTELKSNKTVEFFVLLYFVVRLVNPDIVLAELLTKDDHYDFTMCNPPFFADKSEIIGDHSRTKNRPQPSSVCTGTESETVTTGGEVVFVGKMIDDSLRLGTRVK